MSKIISEAQENLVKLFRDVYFKAGSPLSYKDEMSLRSVVQNLVSGIRDEVLSELEARKPAPAPPPAGGDPFPAKTAPPAPKPVEEKRGFFGNLLGSKVVENPHAKKK